MVVKGKWNTRLQKTGLDGGLCFCHLKVNHCDSVIVEMCATTMQVTSDLQIPMKVAHLKQKITCTIAAVGILYGPS